MPISSNRVGWIKFGATDFSLPRFTGVRLGHE